MLLDIAIINWSDCIPWFGFQWITKINIEFSFELKINITSLLFDTPKYHTRKPKSDVNTIYPQPAQKINEIRY